MTNKSIPLNVSRMLEVIKTSIKDNLGGFKPLDEAQHKKLKADLCYYIEHLKPAGPSLTAPAFCVDTRCVVTGRYHDLHVLYIYNDGTQDHNYEGSFQSNRKARLYYKTKCMNTTRSMRMKFTPVPPVDFISVPVQVTKANVEFVDNE